MHLEENSFSHSSSQINTSKIRDTSATDVTIERKSNTWKIAIAVCVVLLVIAFAANALISTTATEKSIDRASVQIAKLEYGELIRDVVANGVIIAANAPQIYSPEQGFVDLKVQAGEAVTKGQLLAVIESPELRNSLAQEQSELQRLKDDLARQELDARRQTLQLSKQLDMAAVDLDAAERENRRAQKSIEKNVISQIDLEKAVDDLARAKLTFKHAKQDVELAKDTLAFELESTRSTVNRQALIIQELERKLAALNITSSVDGVVGNLLVQPRALVNNSSPLMTLVDLSAYEVELNIAESHVSELSIGLPVEIRMGNDYAMGELRAISPEVQNRQVTARVRFSQESLPNIRQNQQITARILLENKENILKVRRGSFMNAGGFVAYKVEGDIATKIEIQTGAKSMREVEILAGLSENDEIIISNYENFIDAESVLLRD